MSFGMVAAGIGAVGVIASSSASRSATSAAADSNAQALAAQERATADRLAFDREVYDAGAEDRKFASNRARQVADWQTEDRTKYNRLQDEQIARGRKFQGVEDQMLSEAQQFDTEGKQQELAGKAMADVEQGFASAQGSATRNMSRMGINPDSGRADATRTALQLGKAGALSFAGSKARSDATTMGYARKMDAVALGKGMIGNQATQAQLQLNSGNAAVSNAQVPLSVSAGANGAMSAGYGNAANGYASVGNNQQRSFTMAGNYGAGVGADVGNAFGQLSRNPAVLSSIGSIFQPSASYSPIAVSNAANGTNFHPSDLYGD